MHALQQPDTLSCDGEPSNQVTVHVELANEETANQEAALVNSNLIQQTTGPANRASMRTRSAAKRVMRSPLTTHVQDTTLGMPASGLPVEVWVQVAESNTWVQIAVT